MRFLTAAVIVGASFANNSVHNRTQPLSFIEACPEITTRCNVPTAPTAPSDEIARALECLQQTDLATVPAGPCHAALSAILGRFDQVPFAQASPEMLETMSIALTVPISVRLGPGQVRGQFRGKRSFFNARLRRRPGVMDRRPGSENRTKPEHVRRNETSLTDLRNRTSVWDRMRRSRGKADGNNNTEGKSVRMFEFKADKSKNGDDERKAKDRNFKDASKKDDDRKPKKDDDRKPKKDDDRKPKKDDHHKAKKDDDRKSKKDDRKSKDGDKSRGDDRKSRGDDRKDGDHKTKESDRKSKDEPREKKSVSSILRTFHRPRFAKQNRTNTVRVSDESVTGNDIPEQTQQVEETLVQVEETPMQTEQMPTTLPNSEMAPLSPNIEIEPASFATN